MELGRRSFSSFVLGAALVSACTPRARPRAPSFAPRLADERLFRRVHAAQDAVRRMGAVWPDFEDTVVLAMLVYDAHGEWFFGTAEDIPGFVRTGQTMHGLPVSYAEPSLFLAGRVTPFDTIRSNGRWLGRMGWRDFPPSERRRSEPMILMREADTAIENGNLRSIEEWIALYVHECFHVFQRRHTDVMRATRIDPDEDDDREALDVLTAKDSSFRQAIALELAMTQAVGAFESAAAARRSLADWLTKWRSRMIRYARAFKVAGGVKPLETEELAQLSTEGTARYVQNQYLRTPALREDPRLADDAVKGDVREQRGGTYYYELGDRVCRLLDVASPGWKRRAFDRGGLLIDAVKTAVA